MNWLRKLWGQRMCPNCLCRIERALEELQRKVGEVMANQADAAAELVAVKDKLEKVRLEFGTATDALMAKIGDLEKAVENAGQITPELQAAIDGVKEKAQVLDDMNPDAA